MNTRIPSMMVIFLYGQIPMTAGSTFQQIAMEWSDIGPVQTAT
jgi:hypothetical protein